MRRKSIPWIHRWSRPLMGGIASVGAAVTGYLTIVKLTGDSTACPTNGCDIVLSSAIASLAALNYLVDIYHFPKHSSQLKSLQC